jgi:DNA-binding CsgD family transcriptional regulator
VAASMGVSRNTARKYVQAVLQKLGAHTQLEAVALARRSSLLAPSD